MKLPHGLRELESRLDRIRNGIKTDGDTWYWDKFDNSFYGKC
jgi:hypothetical protein